MGRPRLEPDLHNWSRTKRECRGGRRAGVGRSRGGGRGSSGRGNIGSGRGSEEIMDCLGPNEAELQQIKGLGLSEPELRQIEGLGLSKAEDVGIASQITIEELPTTQALGDEERMNEDDD
ncbi:unnamed protein product [Lactuca saligna]|uniref:Uncharacterized protein n=1 Tax=Lactuca saligna TaxID=75948 RepID=A0AA35YAB8_LACSI|nr:unnamed protein product [Lactuca saligna]